VDAYPNQPFEGEVLKIEPQAETQQNVTMFPVLIRIRNLNGQLKPGMNTDVEIHIGERDNVLAVPNAALRTQRDVASAAQVLGIPDDRLQTLLAAAQARRDSLRAPLAANQPRDDSARVDTAKRADPKPAGNTYTMQDGREIQLPAGVSAKQVQTMFAKFRNREELTPADRQLMQQLRQSGGFGGMGGGRGGGMGGGGFGGGAARRAGGSDFQFGGEYIVFVNRSGGPTPTYIRTGLTDLDYSEVVRGLSEKDSVLVLPSASLVQSQQDMRSRFTQMTGGGGAVPGMQQQRPGGATGAGGGGGGARPPAAAGGGRP
jgi:HlyD family secretion protein